MAKREDKQKRHTFCALVLLLPAIPRPAAPPLEGCPTEAAIASGMAKLAADDWTSVSLAKLRTIWPTELSGLDCDADACRTVWSKDRIIGGHCECCSTFAFTIHQKDDGKRVDQLEEVILNYSVAERDLLVEAAKKIVGAAGLNATELATLGSTEEQDFHWAAGKKELSTIELRFKHEGNVWELFLNWGRFTSH
jgi:hypothetical protein